MTIVREDTGEARARSRARFRARAMYFGTNTYIYIDGEKEHSLIFQLSYNNDYNNNNNKIMVAAGLHIISFREIIVFRPVLREFYLENV